MTHSIGSGIDRDHLAAFVDGELSPEEAAELVMHLADHPGDQAYVDDLIAANEALARAFDAPLHEPVPEAIRKVIFPPLAASGEGGTGPARRRWTAMPVTIWASGVALAASVFTAVAVWLIVPDLSREGPVVLAEGKVPRGGALDALLSTTPSGVPVTLGGGTEAMILATLPTRDNRFCREFETHDLGADRLRMGIACTHDDGWTVEVVLSETLSSVEGTGFSTASGPGTRAIDAFLDRIGVGTALDPGEEARQIERGWHD